VPQRAGKYLSCPLTVELWDRKWKLLGPSDKKCSHWGKGKATLSKCHTKLILGAIFYDSLCPDPINLRRADRTKEYTLSKRFHNIRRCKKNYNICTMYKKVQYTDQL